MFLSVIIYGLLLAVMLTMSKQAYMTNKNGYILFSSLFYGLVFGLRYGVGRDYPAYLTNYLAYLHNSIPITQDEVGFTFIQDFFSSLGAHPIIFFGFISFVEIFLCYYAIICKKELLIPFTIVYVLTAVWLPFSSALRQALATCVFFVALKYTDLKSFLKFILLVLLCFSIHKSAALLFIIYPLFIIRKEWFSKPIVELLVYWISVVCMVSHVFESLLNILDNQIETLAILLSYDIYLDPNYADALYTREEGIGLGQLVYILLYSIFIVFSKRVKQYFDDEYFSKSYDLFFVGAVLKCLFNGSNIFGRVTWYFEYFYIIVGAYTLFYLFKKDRGFYYISFSLIFLIFIAILYKGDINFANYYFWWDKAQFEAEHAGNVIKVPL